MDEKELQAKINELEQAANTLKDFERKFKLSDISQLRMQVAGMAIAELVAKMQVISLPSIQQMDAQIAAARDATAAHSARVAAFDSAYGILKGFLGIMV